jgi:hypothetical protein
MSDLRLSTDFFDNPKVLRLRQWGGDAAVLSLLRLWAYVARHRPTGDLPGFTDEEIGAMAGTEGEDFAATLARLGFLDGGPGERQVHDWARQQPWVSRRNERSAVAKRNIAIRWHKAGHHLNPDPDCPLCEAAALSTPPAKPVVGVDSSDASRDTSGIPTVYQPYKNGTVGIRTVYESYTDRSTPIPIPDTKTSLSLRSSTQRPPPTKPVGGVDNRPGPTKVGDLLDASPVPEAPPGQENFDSEKPDGATVAKLEDVAVSEWGWLPLTPRQRERANALAPFSAYETKLARELADAHHADRPKQRNRLGYFLGIVARQREQDGMKAEDPPPPSDRAERLEALRAKRRRILAEAERVEEQRKTEDTPSLQAEWERLTKDYAGTRPEWAELTAEVFS